MPLKSLLAAALVGTMSAALAGPAFAEEARDAFQATTLHVSAVGEAHVTPDLATITVGVETEAPTAAEALRKNRTQMGATIDALKAQGLQPKDVQTTGLNLNAQYVFHQNEPRQLTGYQATNTVTILVHDLARLGPTVDAVVGAGANQINGIAFGLSDPKAAEDEARRAAVKALQAKAELYTAATGYRISRLVSLSDGVGEASPFERVVTMAARAKAPTPVEPGQLDVTVDVSAVYELTR